VNGRLQPSRFAVNPTFYVAQGLYLSLRVNQYNPN